jgi:hypothetical protein
MIAAFLKGEIDSPRNGARVHVQLARLGQTRQLVDDADVDDPRSNAHRASVLERTRGYPNQFLFKGLPPKMQWYTAVAYRAEIPEFRYGAFPDWWTLSSGTGVVADGAAGVNRIEIPEAINKQIRDDADAIRDGANRGSLIVVASVVQGPIVVLDGCARATAYALAGAAGPGHVGVILGLSEQITEWCWWPR